MKRKIFTAVCMIFMVSLYNESSAQVLSKFSIYGFFDLEYEMNTDKTNNHGFFSKANSKPPTFDIHHVNVMTNYQIADNDRVFMEIEWEHGPSLSGGGGDGEVKLERAWFEHTFSYKAKIRAGQFLPPLGFFNRVHDATPTYLFQSLPAVYGKHKIGGSSKKRMFAKLATGLQVFGNLAVGENMEFSYAAYLVNGNGDRPQSVDNNRDKGLGFQVGFLPVEGLDFALSYYSEENNFTGSMNRMNTIVAGARYEENGIIGILELQNVSLNDSKGLNYYLELGYAWTSVFTPMVRFDFIDDDTNVDNNESKIYSIGLNTKLQSNIIVKVEDHIQTKTASGSKTDHKFMTTLAVAF